LPQMLVAMDRLLAKPRQIVIAGDLHAADTRALLYEVRDRFLPNATVLVTDGAANQQYLAQNNRALGEMRPVNGRAAAYVCENFTCQAPVTEPAALRELLVR